MFRSLIAVAVVGFTVSLAGCGGGDDDAATNIAPPAPPPAPAGDSSDSSGTNGNGPPTEAASDVTATDQSGSAVNDAADNASALPRGNAKPVNFLAADAALEPYAKPLSIVGPEHFAIIKFDLQGAREAKLLQDLPASPEETITRLNLGGSRAEVGNAAEMLVDVETLWVSLGPPGETAGPGDAPLEFGACAIFKDAASVEKVTSEWKEDAEAASYKGVEYFRPTRAGTAPVFFVDDRFLFVTLDEALVQQTIDAQGKLVESPIFEKLKDANFESEVLVAGSFGPFRDQVTATLEQAIQQSPIPLAPTTAELPAQIDWGTIAINLGGDKLIDIDLEMDKPENAAVMKETLNGLVSFGNIMLQQQQANVGEDPTEKQAFALANALMRAIKIEQAESHVDLTMAKVPELDELPKILAKAQGKAAQANVAGSARLLGIAAHSYQAATGKWPANIKNDAGEEVLSWRVAILPYIEERNLQAQFDKQASWDSEFNKVLIANMPDSYLTPDVEGEGMTTWKLLPEAPGGILLVAGGEGSGVPWTQPDSIKLDPADPAASLGDQPTTAIASPEGGYVVVFEDGRAGQLTVEQLKERLAGEGASEPPSTQPSEPQPRTWTHEKTQAKVDAVFVRVNGDSVTLRRTDSDKEVTIPVKALSAEDQEYLKSLEP